MSFSAREELRERVPARTLRQNTPIAMPNIASDDSIPALTSEKRREVEARVLDMGDEVGSKQRLSRRQFFESAGGMVVAFVAINNSFGTIADVSRGQAATPTLAREEDLSWVSDLAEIPAPVRVPSQDRLASRR